MEDSPHFCLDEHDRCPHLDERGLCKIILNVGEDYLCDICREHPRFYNYTDVAEVGIGLSCPEAARIVLGSSDYARMVQIGNVDATADGVDFDGRGERSRVYELLSDPSRNYLERLHRICGEYSIDPHKDSRWLATLDSLEYLSEDHKRLFMRYSSALRSKGKDEILERFLAYLIYRHCTEAFDADDFRHRLSFCMFCERLLAALICIDAAESIEAIVRLASMISEEIEYSDENTLALTYERQ